MTLRLVLDTNVWLDWLVFDDPGVAPLRATVEAGSAQVFIDAACERELARVLAYPRKRTTLDADAQAACLAACCRVAQQAPAISPAVTAALPLCRDPDDQKFLELARDCGADYLVTKDLALLELQRRRARPLPFRIVAPGELAIALGERSPAET